MQLCSSLPASSKAIVKLTFMKNFLTACFLALLAIAPAAAQTERIRSFDSRVTVNADGSMQVVETIVVESAGVDIVHGIYRDFPTRYIYSAGKRYSVLFDVVSLRRDGNSEPYHTEDQENGVRVYFGSSSYNLPDGTHSYSLLIAPIANSASLPTMMSFTGA